MLAPDEPMGLIKTWETCQCQLQVLTHWFIVCIFVIRAHTYFFYVPSLNFQESAHKSHEHSNALYVYGFCMFILAHHIKALAYLENLFNFNLSFICYFPHVVSAFLELSRQYVSFRTSFDLMQFSHHHGVQVIFVVINITSISEGDIMFELA